LPFLNWFVEIMCGASGYPVRAIQRQEEALPALSITRPHFSAVRSLGRG
jgi:hypothetical protein